MLCIGQKWPGGQVRLVKGPGQYDPAYTRPTLCHAWLQPGRGCLHYEGILASAERAVHAEAQQTNSEQSCQCLRSMREHAALMEHAASLSTAAQEHVYIDVLHLDIPAALAQLTGQGPAGVVPGQYSPPAGMPLPYTSCATLLPSTARAAKGFVCNKASRLQETVRAPPTVRRHHFGERPAEKHVGDKLRQTTGSYLDK